MYGLKRNVAGLFQNKGKLFVLAMDHAQGGLVPGLGDPEELLARCGGTQLDGFLMNVGLADRMTQGPLLHKKLLLRTSFGGSMLSGAFTNVHQNHVSPETAQALGADAVAMMMVMGGADYKSLQDAARAIDAYHRLHIPVVVEILAEAYEKTQTYEVQANGARVAAELGADVVKAFYTEGFEKTIAQCPAPVILAGGAPGADIFEIAREAVQAGAKGFAFGRTLFMAQDAPQMIARLDAILRE